VREEPEFALLGHGEAEVHQQLPQFAEWHHASRDQGRSLLTGRAGTRPGDLDLRKLPGRGEEIAQDILKTEHPMLLPASDRRNKQQPGG
jgi:hypothetical protein